MSGVCGAMSGEGGWNRSGFRTAGGEGGAGKWLSIFLGGAFFLTMVRRRRVDADRLCFQVGSHRFFLMVWRECIRAGWSMTHKMPLDFCVDTKVKLKTGTTKNVNVKSVKINQCSAKM